MDFSIGRADAGGVTDPFLILVAGLGVGVVFGTFGAGGSAFATPVLALLGVPPVMAVASPLPAMVPASIAGRGATCARGTSTGVSPASR